MAKILIVEDDPLIMTLYEKIFILEGYDVVKAANGEEGLEIAKKVMPTLIVLDVMMPKMNGFDLLVRLKKDPQIQNIPVVMLTNLAGTQDAQKALSEGAVKYLIKSEFTPKQVVNLVKEIIAGYTRNKV